MYSLLNRRQGSVHRMDSAAPMAQPPSPEQPKRIRWSVVGKAALVLVISSCAVAGIGAWRYFHARYQVAETMQVPLQEVTTAEYPEDPAHRSTQYGRYNGRQLTLVQKDDRHFDFILQSTRGHVAKIVFRNVDVSLMTPNVPKWCQGDPGLVRIALTDREWNRQQVSFDADADHVEVTGGDGFEKSRLSKAALAKNCLNAGLWEVILTVEEEGRSAMYYQGWFTFPLGHYRRIFEQNTGLSYADHWYPLEHWQDPAGTKISLDRLRQISYEREVAADFNLDEPIRYGGEQARKTRTTDGENLVTWGDMLRSGRIEFASFIPPGRYSVQHPWSNEYWRLAKFEKAIVRQVAVPAVPQQLHELELLFRDRNGRPQRFIIGGVDLAALPQLSAADYPQGLYMPMGIGVPPFYQSYAQLKKNPPRQSAYYSFLLDKEDRWIDHHKAAIDGPVMHRDLHDPNLLHVYLLSYERHTLVAHLRIRLHAEDAPRLARPQNGSSVR